MKVPAMIVAELRRLVSTRMALIALVALMCVPILYGGLYLWANQDPYARLSQVPAALVVSDTGATIGGTERNLGSDVADQLVADHSFAWERVDQAAADAGLANGTYDFAVELPAGFSAAVASLTSADPQQAPIVLRTNDANNYLASTIGAQAVARIQTTVAQKVVDEAGLTMLDALATIRLKLADAADGAARLADGVGTAVSGATQLEGGSATLASGTAALRDGASALASGAQQVADGTARIDAAAQRVAGASADAAAEIPAVRDDIRATLVAASVAQDRIDAVLAALDPVGARLTAANGRIQDAAADIRRLDDGAHQVASGSAQLADGAAFAADGAGRLHDGIGQLGAGLTQLQSGAGALQSGLADGVAQIPDNDQATREKQASTIGDPVTVHKDQVTAAANYGAGLAPFFAALAAWIGIYALFLIVKPISRRAVTALHSPLRVTLAGWATPALLGGIQMIGLFAVLAIALGFPFAHPLATLGIMVLASLTYTAIILALNVWLGSVGQFLGLVLMVLQLVTAGGTFPWQTLPPPLAGLHHVLPMGYVVDALRQVMYGGDLGRLWTDLGVLVAWLLGAGILAAVGVTRMTHFRTLRDLQPSLIG